VKLNLKIYYVYSKKLFRPLHKSEVSLDESRCDNIPQVPTQECMVLVSSFSKRGGKRGLFQMYHNSSLGLSGFPIEFYQGF
jgi:hypothetical protein